MKKKVLFKSVTEREQAIADNPDLRIEGYYDHIVNTKNDGTVVRETGIIFTDEPVPAPVKVVTIDPVIQSFLDGHEKRIKALETTSSITPTVI